MRKLRLCGIGKLAWVTRLGSGPAGLEPGSLALPGAASSRDPGNPAGARPQVRWGPGDPREVGREDPPGVLAALPRSDPASFRPPLPGWPVPLISPSSSDGAGMVTLALGSHGQLQLRSGKRCRRGSWLANHREGMSPSQQACPAHTVDGLDGWTGFGCHSRPQPSPVRLLCTRPYRTQGGPGSPVPVPWPPVT